MKNAWFFIVKGTAKGPGTDDVVVFEVDENILELLIKMYISTTSLILGALVFLCLVLFTILCCIICNSYKFKIIYIAK